MIYEGPKAGEEGSLNHGRLAAARLPLQLELDRRKAGNDSPGDTILGFSVMPTLLLYFLLPETDEF